MKTHEELHQQLIDTFPGIDLVDLDCHGGIERMLANYVSEFTKKQWGVILSKDMDDFFQDGMAHIDWNTDRSILFKAIQRSFKPRTSWSSSDTWVDIVTSEYQSPTGVCFRLTKEIPRAFSGGHYKYRIQLIDESEFHPVYTHTAIILGISNDGTAYIKSQCTGTLPMCEKFVENNLESGYFFKIVERI